MAINHRKLSPSCESFCDPILNPKGSCPIPCASWCPSVCTSPFPPLLIPQPNPPPAAKAAASGGHSVNKLHLLLIIFLSTLAAACFAFCCFTFYKFYKSRQTSRRRSLERQQLQEEGTNDEFLDANHGPVLDHPIWFIRTVGLQPNVINAITVCNYKRGDGLVEGTECSVCLNEFQDDDTLRLLPKCNHAFHIPCIDTWLRSHTNCPLCRAGIVSNTAAASFPTPAPPDQSVDNPVAVEEAPVVIQDSSGELTRERDDPGFELSTGTGEEEENETRVENGGNGQETSKEEAVDEVQPLRRSVSLDSVSASIVSAAIANACLRESAVDSSSSAAQLEKVGELNMSIVPKKVDANQSLARLVAGSSTNGLNSVKRSLSCSGKVFLSRYTRRRNSLLPS